MKITESVVIASPVQKVFKYLSNFRSHKKFAHTFKESKQVTKGKMEVGSKLFSKAIFLGKKIETNSVVTSFTPNEEIAYKSETGPIPSAVQYLFEKDGNSTRVTLHYDIEPGSFFRLGEQFLRPRIGAEVESSLQNLKKILEAEVAATTS
jgi:uncharacterized membrane protein